MHLVMFKDGSQLKKIWSAKLFRDIMVLLTKDYAVLGGTREFNHEIDVPRVTRVSILK